MTPQIGDIFLDPLLIDRIKYMKLYEKINNIGFVTNSIAADRYQDSDLDFIINSTTRIHISVYGLSEMEYSTMTRKKGLYDVMIKNIRRIINLNKVSTLVFGFRFLLNHTPEKIENWMMNNFGQIIPYESLIKYGNWGGAISTEEALPYDAEWLPERNGDSIPCSYPIIHSKIFVNGDVKFCSCVDYNGSEENTIGNIIEDTLSNIYNSEKARNIWKNGLSMCRICTHFKPLSDMEKLLPLLDNPMVNLGV